MRILGTVALSVALSATLAAALAAAPATARPERGGTGDEGAAVPPWQVSVVDADQSFRGLDAVSRQVAWVSGGSVTDGGKGRVYRTTDGGATWTDVSPPGTAGLALRDVEAQSATTALVLSIGEGEDSRIWRTDDGGSSWTEVFRNTDPAAFYDCMDFYPGFVRGLAVSDPVDGKFRVIGTNDGGRTWTVRPDAGMPTATGEFGFAASGNCLVIAGQRAHFGSGGARSRVFRSDDGGRTWRAKDSTIPAGDAAGVFALAFRGGVRGLAVGGDFAAPDDGVDAAASTVGRAWINGGDLTHLAEDAAWLTGHEDWLLVVGEGGDIGGTSLSRDGGRTWRLVSPDRFHTLDCTRDGACWAAGGGGRVGVR